MTTTLMASSLLVIAFTLLSFLRLPFWWIRIFDFPRVQIAVLGTILLLGQFLLLDATSTVDIVWLTSLALCTSYQWLRVLPFTRLSRPQSLKAKCFSPDHSISILVANVYMENRDVQSLLSELERFSPDLLLFLETDEWWDRALRTLKDSFPFAVRHPLANTYGMILYSRFPLENSKVEFLIEDDVPSIRTQVILPCGQKVWFQGLHPRPPVPTEALESAERDGELLLVGRRVGQDLRPTIVAGDLNDVAWSFAVSLMRRLGGLLDPRIGRGLFSTFHASTPYFRWPLDHIFHSDHFQLVALRRFPNVGSDHFPFYAHLTLTAEDLKEQGVPEPRVGDFELAREMIEEAQKIDSERTL